MLAPIEWYNRRQHVIFPKILVPRYNFRILNLRSLNQPTKAIINETKFPQKIWKCFFVKYLKVMTHKNSNWIHNSTSRSKKPNNSTNRTLEVGEIWFLSPTIWPISFEVGMKCYSWYSPNSFVASKYIMGYSFISFNLCQELMWLKWKLQKQDLQISL